MMEILVFTLNAIVIYFLADWIIKLLEARRGEILKQRQAVFFVVFLGLALLSFNILRALLSSTT